MRYMKVKRVIALVVLLTVVGVAVFGRADPFPSIAAANSSSVGNSPSNEERASAEKTGQLLHNELFAALIQEFNETTADNVEGKHAISLIFKIPKLLEMKMSAIPVLTR